MEADYPKDMLNKYSGQWNRKQGVCPKGYIVASRDDYEQIKKKRKMRLYLPILDMYMTIVARSRIHLMVGIGIRMGMPK